MNLLNIILVAIGGFFGAISRLAISKQLNSKRDPSLPLGTITVNLLGAFLLGILTGIRVNTTASLLIGTGFMGAFTTFSTFKLEIIQLHLKKYRKEFITYLIVTYGIGIFLAYIGYVIGSSFI